MKAFSALVYSLAVFTGVAQARGRDIPKDLSGVRGFNYTAASARNHSDLWLNYNPAETDRDMDLARRLDLNQARVFIFYDEYLKDKKMICENLRHFARACHKRGIGAMIVVNYSRQMVEDKASWPVAREYAADLVNTLSGEPGLAFWDVMNEPDFPTTPESWVRQRFDLARYMAGVFHELDPKTPTTIGMAFVPGMEELANFVDVLSFHDYSATRAQIRANIARAKEFASGVGKPVYNTEIGCAARANPYDVTLEEHMNAGVGWYIWELMITRSKWGPIHGIFYGDGTVRDPAIVAAVLGLFRSRGPNIVPVAVDQEGWVTRVVTDSKKWLEQTDASRDRGLDLAEIAANLLEAGELVAMREPPTRQVYMLRRGNPNLSALRILLQKYIDALELYKRECEGE